jgi:hypothetical protein
MRKYGLSELKNILAKVSENNTKEATAKKLSPEVEETKKQKIAALQRELKPLVDSLNKKWKETQGRVESVALSLNARLSKCEAANKRVKAQAGKPVEQVPEAQKPDPFLKSIGIETHIKPAPKK